MSELKDSSRARDFYCAFLLPFKTGDFLSPVREFAEENDKATFVVVVVVIVSSLSFARVYFLLSRLTA